VAAIFFSDTHALHVSLAFRTDGESRDRSPCNLFAPWLAARTRPQDSIKTIPLPSINELVADFHHRGDQHDVVIQE
jgi:hypothetical protein